MSFKTLHMINDDGYSVLKEIDIDIEKLSKLNDEISNKNLSNKESNECNNQELSFLISMLMNPDSFEIAYFTIKKKSLSYRQEKIDKLRSEIDREIRKLTVLIEDENYDYYMSMQTVKSNEKKIGKLLEFDRETALYADKILSTIRIGEIKSIVNEKTLSKKLAN